MCARPLPRTGPESTRARRDWERARDALRCLCGQPGCRDAELLEKK